MSPKRVIVHLRWPLHAESVTAMALLYILGNVLFALNALEASFDGSSLRSVMHWSSVTLFLTLLFYYGLDVIDASARGAERPPRMGARMVGFQLYDTVTEQLGFNLSPMDYPLFRQQLMVTAYLGIATALDSHGHSWPALALQALFILILPASLGVNAVAENKFHMANPAKLAEFAVALGQDYIVAVVALVAAYLCYEGALTATPLAFQLFLPGSLYFSLVMFQALGAGMYARKERFFEEPDFAAERKKLETFAAHLKPIGEMLEEAHELLRAGHSAKAHDLLLAWTRRLGDWKYFDDVFAYVSAWPFRDAGLQLVTAYLPVCLSQHRYMRALDLCEWCLAQDASFTVGSTEILYELIGQAAAPGQYAAVCRLIENYRNTDFSTRQALLKLASGIALTHLNDEERFRQLQQQITALAQSA
jgi:hypothetical protein